MSEIINENINLRKMRKNYYTGSPDYTVTGGFSKQKTDSENMNSESTYENNYINNNGIQNTSDNGTNISESIPAGVSPSNYNESAVTYINTNDKNAEKTEVIYEAGVNEAVPKNPKVYDDGKRNPYFKPAYTESYVKFLSLVPNGRRINIYVNGKKIASRLAPGSETEYISLIPGIYDIEFYFSDSGEIPLYSYRFRALPDTNATLILSGTNNVYSVSEISGSAPACFFNTAYLRFIQLNPNAPAMDVYIDDIDVINGLQFGEVSAFTGVPYGIHNIKITASGTGITFVNKNSDFPSGSVTNMLISTNDGENYYLLPLSGINSCPR